MEMEMADIRPTVEHATLLPGPQQSFTSKADLMNGIMDDDIPDYDFMDD